MKLTFHKTLVWLVAAGTAACLMAGCQKAEEDVAVPERPEPLGELCAFTIEEEDPDVVDPATKSLLTDASIESKQTCVSIGIYADGNLVDTKYFGTTSTLSFTLEYEKAYTAYALVNMGDMTSSFPSTADGLSSMVYNIPAYTGTSESINTRGIPMSGSLSFTVGDGQSVIPVKRLLAKVTANLSCDWAGAKIKSAKVYNMNKVLKPFGTSAASGAGDMLGFQELQSASGEGSTTLFATFYVPENMQGTITGISSSDNKASDKNATVSANAAKLTYLEVEVQSTGMYEGTVKYRSYLGNNSTSNFDLQRNYRYAWTIHYASSKVDDYSSDWKHVLDGMTVSDYSLSLAPNPQTIAVGSNFTYTTTLTKNTIHPTPSSVPATLANSSATWSSDNTSVATVSASGVVTGVSQGTANITARYTPSGADYSERTATAAVTVNTIAHELVITGSPLTADWTETINLTATYYTLTNGVRDAGTNVTVDSGTTWTPATGTIAVAKGSTYAQVTASDYGTAEVRASYNGVTSDPVTVTFNRTDRFLDLSHTPTNALANQTIQMSAKVRTVTNGVTSTSDVPASSVAWSVIESSKSDASASVTVSGAGVVSTNKEVSVNIQGTYDGLTGVDGISFGAVMGYYLQIVGSPVEANVGETISLSAMFHTVTDGSDDGGVPVTASWSRSSGSSNITVGAANGQVTASDYGTAAITASYTRSGTTYNAVPITVTFHKTTHSLVITPITPANTTVGNRLNLTARYYTFLDGVQTGNVNVSANASLSWTTGNAKIHVAKSSDHAEVYADNSVTTTTTTAVTASYAGESVSVNVTFVPNIDYELEVTPASASGTYEAPIQFSARYYTITNGVKDAGVDVTTASSWSQNAGTKYTIGSNTGALRAVPSASVPSIAGSTTVTATYNAISGSASATFTDVVTHSLSTSTPSGHGDYQHPVSLTATYYTFTNGFQTDASDVTGSVSWSCSPAGKYSVSHGSVSATPTSSVPSVAGSTQVTASYLGTTSSTTVTFDDVNTSSLAITSSSPSIQAGGSSVSLTATLNNYTNGFQTGSTNVTSSTSWSSSNSNVTVSAGTATANVSATGTATITATYGGKTATYTLSIGDAVIEYELVVAKVSGNGTYNSPVNLKATYYTITNGVRNAGTVVTTNASCVWSCDQPLSPSRFSVSAGQVSADASVGTHSVAGTVRVTATYNEKSAYLDVPFTDVIENNLVLTPSTSSVTYPATSSVTATYNTVTNGYTTASSDVSNSASWSCTGSPKYAVSAAGVVSAVPTASIPSVNGSTTISANHLGISSNSVTVTFADKITHRLTVTPDGASGTYLSPVVLTATYYTDTNDFETGSTNVTSSATWNCSNTPKYSVSSGVVSAIPTTSSPSVAGSTLVSASYNGYSSAKNVSFTDVFTLEITNANKDVLSAPKVVATGTRVFRALYIQNGLRSIAPFAPLATWSSDSTSIATISEVNESGATVLGVAAGTTTIRASYSGVSASMPITVTAWSDGWDDPDDPEIDL